MAFINKNKKTYSEREKRAYSAGVGYGAAKSGRRVKCTTEAEKSSFRNGLNRARGNKK